jgi:hypothetical protein
MLAHRLIPILNVSDIRESFAWFVKLGWKKGWDWGDPPCFGGVCSGECEIFLCENAQGGRGKSDIKMTFGPDGDETGDKGVWMSIENVDAVYDHCVAQALKSHGLRPTCRGVCERCTCAIPMGTFSGSARVLNRVLSSKVHLILVIPEWSQGQVFIDGAIGILASLSGSRSCRRQLFSNALFGLPRVPGGHRPGSGKVVRKTQNAPLETSSDGPSFSVY